MHYNDQNRLSALLTTPSRLHFGLLALPDAGNDQRVWGGAGLMIQKPGIIVSARRAGEWRFDGLMAERIRVFVKRFVQSLERDRIIKDITPLHIHVEHAAAEHQGLGTGTQLGLAVGRLLADAAALSQMTAADLAQRVGRGARSAVGVHGFEQGGFIVEAGKRDANHISPLIARADFPEQWRIVLILSKNATGLHGDSERRAFAALAQGEKTTLRIDKLCQLLLLGMLPALHECDLPMFGDALYEFNRQVGEVFRDVQGGIYAHPDGEEMIAFLRANKLRGAGQSSWGPALFAVAGDEDEADHTARRVRQRFGLAEDEVLITGAANEGARIAACGLASG